MTPAALMREAHLRLAASAQPPIARVLLADLPSGIGTAIEPCEPAPPVPRQMADRVAGKLTAEERAWIEKVRQEGQGAG